MKKHFFISVTLLAFLLVGAAGTEDGCVEVFLTYNHICQGYIDTTVVEGLGYPPFPGALGELTQDQLSRLRQVRDGVVGLGIASEVVQDRVAEYHATRYVK